MRMHHRKRCLHRLRQRQVREYPALRRALAQTEGVAA